MRKDSFILFKSIKMKNRSSEPKMCHHQTRSMLMTSIPVLDDRLAGGVPPGCIMWT